jgi:hypothetical protein
MAQVRLSFQRQLLNAVSPPCAGLSPGPGPQTALRITLHLSPLLKQRSDAVREAIQRQRYKTSSRILPDHTIIHRPDCVIRCNEQTAPRTMIVHLKLDDRLSVLRAEDRFRKWSSLDDERRCVTCKRKFNGRQVEIRRSINGKYELHCPTEGCNSRPHLWISSATPLVSHVVRSNWWRAVGKKHEPRAPLPALRAHGHRI